MTDQKKYTIAVIGATGNVGKEILNKLYTRKFPVKEIHVIASPNSTGKKVTFGSKTLQILNIKELDFSKVDIAFFCAGSDISKKYAIKAVANKCIVIDKSSFFRLEDDIPLIVPEVNLKSLKDFKSTKIISSPNCCSVPLAIVLKPLDNIGLIKRVVISTYQSVSGAGKGAMDELYDQTKAKFVFENLKPRIFQDQIAFNLFPHIGNFREDGYSEEEYKIKEELKKIIGSHINPTLTCVRVPTFVSHCMSINVEFNQYISAQEAETILEKTDGIITYNIKNELKYATPVSTVGSDEVFVSRIREDTSNRHSLDLWICCDNLRKGSALNAIQIAEKIIS